MKSKELKKKLLFEGLISLVAIVLLSGAAYFLSTIQEEWEKENMSLKADLDKVSNEMNGLNAKYMRVKNDGPLYQKILEISAAEKLSISKMVIQKKFFEFKERYNLNGILILKTDPINPLTDAKYKRASGTVIATKGSLSYDALDDEDIFGLVQAMQNELPGMLKFTSWNLSRESAVTLEGLKAVSMQGHYPFVKGSLGFTWYGIQAADAEISEEELLKPSEPGKKNTTP